ncbi:hypothetical protein GCM10008968_20330 [Bacillus horti]
MLKHSIINKMKQHNIDPQEMTKWTGVPMSIFSNDQHEISLSSAHLLIKTFLSKKEKEYMIEYCCLFHEEAI